MSRTIYKVWSEWDIGEEGYTYASKADAMIALSQNPNLAEVIQFDDDFNTIKDVMDAGLLSLEEITLVGE